MTDKQPDALRLADEVDEVAQTFPDMAEVSAMLRTQHAEIERLTAAATDSNLILERAQATNLEMLAAIERKDALLRQCLDALETDDWLKKLNASGAITKELSQ